MKNIIDPLIERIKNFQFSDTFEIDDDEFLQIEESANDDDYLISVVDIDIDNDITDNKELSE